MKIGAFSQPKNKPIGKILKKQLLAIYAMFRALGLKL
jgi:hypothetical protein